MAIKTDGGNIIHNNDGIIYNEILKNNPISAPTSVIFSINLNDWLSQATATKDAITTRKEQNIFQKMYLLKIFTIIMKFAFELQ